MTVRCTVVRLIIQVRCFPVMNGDFTKTAAFTDSFALVSYVRRKTELRPAKIELRSLKDI